MFSNLHLYRITKPWTITAAELESRLATKRFRPCSEKEIKTSGWISARKGGPLVFVQNEQLLIALCFEQKKIPAPVLDRLANTKAAKWESDKGYKPSRKELSELRSEALIELLPRAFESQVTIQVWISPKDRWIGIDTSAPAKADDVVAKLLDTLSVSAALVQTKMDASTAMSQWLINNEAPDDFAIDREVELKGLDIDKPVVKYKNLSLQREEVRQHILEGRRPVRLALTWNERVSFSLTDKNQLKKIALHKSVFDDVEEDPDDEESSFKSLFEVTTKELSQVFPSLMEALGGEESYDS